MIEKIVIKNYKIFEDFALPLNAGVNILVGDNETGKSTLIEAIGLALTRKIGGRPIEYEITSHIFNKACAQRYLVECVQGKNPPLPTILIELYLTERPELQFLRGSNNSQRGDFVGVKLEVVFDDDYREEYGKLLEDCTQLKTIPSEYYRVNWFSFANNAITARSLPIASSYIDATAIRLQSGTDYYLQSIISESLTTRERVSLAVAFRKLKEKFSQEPSISNINTKLTQNKGAITKKLMEITVDTSQRSNWETSLIPHLDQLPFHLVGKGEQSIIKILLALENKGTDAHIILIEEPENHLSFPRMNQLLSTIEDKCTGKQMVIATHSAYVLNKLGIGKVILLANCRGASLRNLSPDTQKYFKKISGYDTLRLILAKQTILVEGPSDELIVQKSYFLKHGKLPIEDGVDVLNVRGLSFPRFLEIATELKSNVRVVTDNDGDYQTNIVDRYAPFKDVATIKICADQNNDYPSLESQLVRANGVTPLNKVFGTSFKGRNSLVQFMTMNKTECALKLFETPIELSIPSYIENAVD